MKKIAIISLSLILALVLGLVGCTAQPVTVTHTVEKTTTQPAETVIQTQTVTEEQTLTETAIPPTVTSTVTETPITVTKTTETTSTVTKTEEITVTKTTTIVPLNRAPNIPSNPSPPNHAIDIYTFTLSWSGGDPDPGDTVMYNVYFGTSLSPPLLFSYLSETTVTEPFPMPPPSTKCYWKIIATDNHGASTEGPLWDFTTTAEPIKPPFLNANTPTGPSIGKVGQTLTYSTSASSNIVGNPEYRFDWGDGSYSPWSSLSSASHFWPNPGAYTIRAQARHPGIISEWSPGKVVKIETQLLSRNPLGQPEQMKQYVTPDDPRVKAAVNDILSGQWRWAYNDFNALREWVCWHVSYRSDQDVHGVSEYWQLPAETLELGTGDCEDFAILLCSLLRAYGVPDDQVYVACGFGEDEPHGTWWKNGIRASGE